MITTLREQQTGSLYYGDSNGPVSPAGAAGLSWSIGSPAHWLANYFSIPPTISTPGSTATTTYTYDNNGNLTWATAGATSTNYVYDYANRLTQLAVGASGATTTTTYAYDASGSRVSQTNGSVITVYPSKYFSEVMTTSGATTTATSTEFVFSPAQGSGQDTLLATIDQPLVNGTATGTPVTRYNHPDNLGSTAVTSDSVGNLAQSFNYAPYGSVLSTTNTGTTTAARQYIGQFTDISGLSYLNARFYNPNQGQFLTQDSVFLSPQQNLQDPQSLNSYSYSENNPILKSDPSGKCPWCVLALGGAGAGIVGQFGIDVFNNYQSYGLDVGSYSLSSPETYLTRAVQGAAIAATGGIAGDVFGLSLAGQSIAVGASSGVSGVLSNAYLGQPITPQSVFFDTAVGVVSYGLLGLTPGVSGRLPNFATPAFFTGAHTEESALTLGVSSIVNYLGSLFGTASFSNNNQTSSRSSSVSSGSGLSVTSSQFSSLIQLGSAFTPSNAAQSQSLQNVFSAFAGNK